MRHGGAALLTLTEGLLGLERVGLLQVADLGRDALAGGRCSGKHAGKVGMVIAADDLRGQRVVNQTQMLADILFDKRLDGAVRADSARDSTEGNILAGVLKTIQIALELPGPRAKLHAEGHRLGVDAMSAAGTERVALLKGATLANLAELLDILDDQVAGLGELVAQGRVAQIGAGHAIVNPAAGLGVALGNIGIDVFLHVGQEGNDVVARDFLDLIDLRLLKVGMVADPLGLVFGNTDLAELRLGLAGQDLDLLPNGVLVLEGEDVSHLRAGIAIDHSGSFLVIGTLVVTQPLYRAQVQVWAAGINLTFWNWSEHRDVRAFASQIRTGCGRSPRIHGDDGENFVELAVPSSPALGGAGNGTSAYLLRKSAPAAVAYRRPCLLAINASRLFNARTLSGSSPGTLLKKARHRNGAVLVLLAGAGNGTRTRECQLGKLMPYHLAMPAYVLASITRLSCSIQGWRCLF